MGLMSIKNNKTWFILSQCDQLRHGFPEGLVIVFADEALSFCSYFCGLCVGRIDLVLRLDDFGLRHLHFMTLVSHGLRVER